MKIMHKSFSIFIVTLCVTALYADNRSARPGKWAEAVQSPLLKNFYRLDGKVYRSAQPDKQGFQYLKSLGIINVLNLRDNHKDDSQAEGLGLNLFRVEMKAEKITVDDTVAALRRIKNAKGPIVIHCWHGSDRTGTVSAMYRVIFQNWTKEDALDELVNGGYGYHKMYKNIPEFIRNADVEGIKRRVFEE